MKAYLLILITIGIYSCETGTKTFQTTNRTIEIDFSKPASNSLDTLYQDDTLLLQFPVPHPKDLAISDADGNFYFLVYAMSDAKKPSLVDWESFETMRSMKVVGGQTKANPWNETYTENQSIFQASGIYEVQLSENLETDDGTPIESRRLYYSNSKREKSSD